MNLMRLRSAKQTLLVMNEQAWDAMRDDIFRAASRRPDAGCVGDDAYKSSRLDLSHYPTCKL